MNGLNPNANAQALGQLIGTGLGLYQRRQDQKSSAQNQVQAAQLLNQSLMLMETDPEASQQAFIQAQQLDPAFVQKTVAGLVQQRGLLATEKEKPLSEYQRQSLELRRSEQELARLKMEQSKETNELRQAQLQAQIDKIQQGLADKKSETAQKDEQAVAQIDETIGLLDRMIEHPGRSAATGLTAPSANIPGTSARGFRALLDTLKGQQFLNEVQALKGMGQLSNAEGDKLAAAAASLDLGMPEDEFLAELKRIRGALDKARNTKAGTYKTGGSTEQPAVIKWSDL